MVLLLLAQHMALAPILPIIVAEPAAQTSTSGSTALSMLTHSCPGGTQYKRYAGCRLEVSGGTKPYTFSTPVGEAGFKDRRSCTRKNNVLTCSGKSHGTLPEGLVLNASTGSISSPSIITGMGTYSPLFIVTDASGAVLQTDQILFPIDGNSTLAGCEFFPENSIFHTKITDLPIDTSPAAPIAAQYLHGRIHPLFGSSRQKPKDPIHSFGDRYPFGMPYIRVPHDTRNETVSKSVPSDSAVDFREGPFPLDAPMEGSANSGYGKPGGDRHLLIIQEAGGGEPCKLFEMYQGRRHDPDSNTTWTASAMALWPNISSNQLRPNGRGSTDACGLPVAPLLAMFDEACGSGPICVPAAIRHPIRFTVTHMLQNWVWPARVQSGKGQCLWENGSVARYQLPQGANGPSSCSMSGPCGQIYRLKKDISTPPSCKNECQVFVQAFRDYGIILSDNGGSGGLCGTPDARWNGTAVAAMSQLTLADFEPVDVSSLIIDNDSAQARQVKSDDDAAASPYRVIWNSPWPLGCYRQHFNPLIINFSKYDIQVNGNGNGSMSLFGGEKLILYNEDLGLYPQIESGKLINGGIPQLAIKNLSAHLAQVGSNGILLVRVTSLLSLIPCKRTVVHRSRACRSTAALALVGVFS